MRSQEELRRDNLIRLLDIARRRGALAQVELARATGLRPSTVSYLARILKERGMIVEAGKGSAGPAGGKPSVYLSLAPDFGYFTGALLQGGELTTSLVNFVGEWEQRRRVPIKEESTEAIYEGLHREIATHREQALSRGSRYLGIGLAVASVVDGGGSVHPSADFPYDLSDLPTRLSAAAGTQATVVVENDANCAALFHHQRLAEPTGSILSIVFSHTPDSVGAGLLLDGTLYRGANGGAGEILPRDFRGDDAEVDELVAAAVRLTDPAVVLLATESGERFSEGRGRLREELAGREVVHAANPEASLRGAAFLAYERALPGCIVDGNGKE